MRLKWALAVAAAALPAAALAHAPGSGWETLPLRLAQALFVVSWFAYAWGAAQRRPSPARRAALHGAMSVAGLALFGPFDDWAGQSTAWHMVQHMLLMVVVGPLLVLARPLPQWRAALGHGADAAWRAALVLTQRPLACATLHGMAIWFWHAPALYTAALLDPGLHLLEHISFLGSALLFWQAVLGAGRSRAPAAALALLLTLMHTGLLGALLTFAREPLYLRESRELWDQQLAGLVMWIPGGAAYLLATILVTRRLLVPAAARAG